MKAGIDKITYLKKRIAMGMTYVIDSNIPLLDAHNIYTLGSSNDTIVIPETVLDEIDSKKSGLGELAYQAREFGRLMTAATYTGQVHKGNATYINYNVKDTIVTVVALDKYPSYVGMEKNVLNDRKIIECALAYKKAVQPNEEVVFMTNDVACGIRAQSLGLDTTQLRDVTDSIIDYTVTLQVCDEDFRALHGKGIRQYDNEYKKGSYNYHIMNEDTGQVKLATIKNGIINVLGKETEQELRKQEVNPSNAGQLFMSRAIQDQTIPLVIVEALSGSGKTLMALSNAIKLVKVNSPYNSIIYVRGSVDDVEEVEAVGFLKGSADEKNEIYFHPLLDSLNHIAKRRLKGSKAKGKQLEEELEKTVNHIIEDCDVQMLTGLGMRGRTFEDAVVIIDESQNFSKASLRKILTRFGKNCKIIVIGSNRQIDNPYITKYTNGLSVLLDAATKEQMIDMHVVTLDKVVRSEFAEFAENIFE